MTGAASSLVAQRVRVHSLASQTRCLCRFLHFVSSGEFHTFQRSPASRAMASKASSKLIFAPGENASDSHNTNQAQQAGQFKIGTLTREDLDPDPFALFHTWFTNPKLQGLAPETVTLSTAELPSGRVSSRMVYLKELDDRGFVIYSNWGTSRKAHDISTNPYASLCFWWKPLERQVRVSGPAHRLTSAESQVYYDTRARGSRIGAWASQQSSILHPQKSHARSNLSNQSGGGGGGGGGGSGGGDQDDDNEAPSNDDDDGRAELNAQVHAIESRFQDQDQIPVPEFWGGLRVVPDRIEFWQGRDNRLHDRFEYIRDDVELKEWKINRLSP